MFARASTAVAVVLALCAGVSVASQVEGVSFYGGGMQIWMTSSSFDAKTPDFVDDTANSSMSLSGHAYYFPANDPADTLQPWYAEYSLHQDDVPGVPLEGTWNFWARCFQPGGTQPDYYQDSDFLFVKDDPGDGSGNTWYQDALASWNNDDDRIFNDIFAFTSNGWAWPWFCNSVYAQDPQGQGYQQEFTIPKDFSPDNGVVTFRLSEREAGPYNVRADVICWTTTDFDTWRPTSDSQYASILAPQTRRGDTDQDGDVDGNDFVNLAVNYTGTGDPGQFSKDWGQGDFDYDGDVDGTDFVTLAVNYTGTTAAVPEPASLALLALGLAVLRRRRP